MEHRVTIREREWNILSRLKPLALERLCRRILEGARELSAAAAEGTYYQTYLALYRYIREQDRLIADCFDDWSRSRALIRLAIWRQQQLLTDEECAAFSPEIREEVTSLLAGSVADLRVLLM
ncbi:MAG: peptide ABC transporter substrate-binding protein [Anaerolineae bacterium]|nr:peptide ABC transporter substrate-binding protein [Anaerolineae bacterium]